MTSPKGAHVSSITFINYLPAALPDPEEIRSAGTTFGAKGTQISTAYSHTVSHWNKLSSVATYPDDDMVNNGFVKEILPLAEAVTSGITNIKKATDAFAASLDGFKTRHSNLKEEVANFNALPDTTYSADQQSEASEDGTTLPTTRTAAERSRLIGLLSTAKGDYKGYIDTCVDSITASSPAAVTPGSLKNSVAIMKGFKNTYNMVNKNVDRAAKIDVTKGGRLKASWSYNERTLSQFAFDGAPNLKRFLLEGKVGPLGSSEFLKNHSKELTDWADGKFLKFSGKLNAWTDMKLGPGLALLMPAALKEKMPRILTDKKGTMGTGNRQLSWKKNAHGRTQLTMKVTGQGDKTRFDKTLANIEKADGTLKKISKSPITKWAGRGLGVVDVGMTYYDSYNTNYNEALRNNPDADPGDIQREAATSTAIEGTAETAGKVAGGVVGRGVGAALGQAIIPIPGVGAAVGGFVGGIVGEKVGGVLGKGVGEFINDWRQGGAGKAFGDTADAAANAGKAIGDGVKDVGKSIGKKLFGWG